MTADNETPQEEMNSKNMFVCSHCPKTFRYNSERLRHEISHSPEFECEICCKKFSFISALRRHCKLHERKGNVKCEECNKKFRDDMLLQRHIKYAHKETCSCSKCGSKFSSEQALSTHMKTHRPVSERRFKCSFHGCGKSFNFSHHLKHHELTHTNEKQHYCSVCGKGFIQLHHLKIHLKTHDPSEWLYCKFPGCKKKFTTEYAKKRHMATHKAKPDSGISSDSNSCDTPVLSKNYAEDFILCASCGESLHQSDIPKHSIKCIDILHMSADMESSTISSINEGNLSGQAFITTSRQFESRAKEENNTVKTEQLDKDIPDCKSALGGCIMDSINCVCTHISKTVDDNYDFTPIDNTDNIIENNTIVENNSTVPEINNNDFLDKYSEDILNFFDDKENENVNTVHPKEMVANEKATNIKNICEGCDCASICSIKDKDNCDGTRKKTFDTSNVHIVDGVVKIKDMFDIDIPIHRVIKADRKIDKMESNAGGNVKSEFVSFNTCKDVLGNCLVGGSEGCLCAKMMIDEQQAMAQEIDDLTPVPTECYAL